MECPKCHRNIPENTTVCPYCHKVFALTCPNCKTVSKHAVCKKCGYIILEKCHKCGKLVPTTSSACKCGFSTSMSIAYNECEIDEFASLILNFGALKTIRSALGSREFYEKFKQKLKNLISAQLKGINAHIITYGDTYVINFCKDLSFSTSVDKAIRTAIKLATAFTGLNLNMIEQIGSSLKLDICIIRKNSEELLTYPQLESNIKMIVSKGKNKKYIRDMQVLLDQDCHDAARNYKADSLYYMNVNGSSVMFYQLILDEYVIPPSDNLVEAEDVQVREIQKISKKVLEQQDKIDLYSFKVFDINAQCSFIRCTTENLERELDINKKIISIKTEKDIGISTKTLVDFYTREGIEPIYICCTEELTYKPWGVFDKLLRAFFKLSVTNGLIDPNTDIKPYNASKDLILGNAPAVASSEDARYKYIEQFGNLLSENKRMVIIIDGFEHIDNTSLQALELYFDKYANIYTNFIFITNEETPVHSKIKGLLQTFLYKEITLQKSSLDEIISITSKDATNFIESFYYERIKESYNGSRIYYDHAIKYLTDVGVLAKFENKFIIKNNASYMIPKDINSLIKTRLKSFAKYMDASMILAYSVFLGERMDFRTLEELGVNNIPENVQFLQEEGFAFRQESDIYINNYNLVKDIILSSLKSDVQEYIVQTILAKLGKSIDTTTLMLLMATLSKVKEEYLLLWKNSQYAINTGDYDAYLKNCLGFLSLIDKLGENIPREEIENNKKDIMQNIFMSLYSYSPTKIYSIGDILLMDAMQEDDNDKIIKLSNLMLQSALITANYKMAHSLLYNILSRMPDSSLIVDGAINTKFLLLSIINIEILFNIGNYTECIELAEELLSIIKPEIIDKIKPANFSLNMFINHLLEAFRIAGFAKVIKNDKNLNEFFTTVKNAIGADIPEKDCIRALQEFINGKDYTPSNIEIASPFSKVIFLILSELSKLRTDYNTFAQNIYQAKLLATDLHQTQLEYICEALIGYSYAKVGVKQKAEKILSDIVTKAESSAIFNVIAISKFLMAKVKIDNKEIDEAMLLINDTLADIQKHANCAKVYYAMFERLFIEAAQRDKNLPVDIQNEINKLTALSNDGGLQRIVGDSLKQKIYNERVNDDLANMADNSSYSNHETESHP